MFKSQYKTKVFSSGSKISNYYESDYQGINRSSVKLDGVDQYITVCNKNIPKYLSSAQSGGWSIDEVFTISCWIRFNALSGDSTIFSIGHQAEHQLNIYVDSSGNLKIDTGYGLGSETTTLIPEPENETIQTNIWYFLQVSIRGQASSGDRIYSWIAQKSDSSKNNFVPNEGSIPRMSEAGYKTTTYDFNFENGGTNEELSQLQFIGARKYGNGAPQDFANITIRDFGVYKASSDHKEPSAREGYLASNLDSSINPNQPHVLCSFPLGDDDFDFNSLKVGDGCIFIDRCKKGSHYKDWTYDSTFGSPDLSHWAAEYDLFEDEITYNGIDNSAWDVNDKGNGSNWDEIGNLYYRALGGLLGSSTPGELSQDIATGVNKEYAHTMMGIVFIIYTSPTFSTQPTADTSYFSLYGAKLKEVLEITTGTTNIHSFSNTYVRQPVLDEMDSFLSSNQKTALHDVLSSDDKILDCHTASAFNLVGTNKFTADLSAAFTIVSKRARLENGANSQGIVSIDFDTTAGHIYELTFDIVGGNSNLNACINTSAAYDASVDHKVANIGKGIRHSLLYDFKAPGAKAFIVLQLTSSTSGKYCEINNLRLKRTHNVLLIHRGADSGGNHGMQVINCVAAPNSVAYGNNLDISTPGANSWAYDKPDSRIYN
tara:strand:- start:2606 stop:4573 length:1968 start_codon:yes stop_codon:yes gene_type:complete